MKEPPITNVDGFKLKRGLNVLYFEFEYRKMRTIKGGTMVKLICATKCSNIYMHHQINSQESLHFTLTLAVLRGAALPHLKRDTTAVRHSRTWATALTWLKWPLGAGGYLYPSPSSPTALCLFFLTLARSKQKGASLSPSIVDLEPSSKSTDFPINLWEKRVQNSTREQLHWFLNFKEHLVHVLTDGCVCYSWILAPSRLERRPWSLPTCVAVREVCNHLLKLLNSPLIPRVRSLDLRMRKGWKALSLSG